MSRPAHPWRVLTDAALAYAAATTEQEFERASMRLLQAARRYRDEPRPNGRPPEHVSKPIARVLANLKPKAGL
jgi:hypothetical protein